jgi:hypothetical protein
MTTTQVNPILLARQGNVRALARLLNQALSPHGVAATVVRHEDQLQVSLESTTVPDADQFGELVRVGIVKLGIDQISVLTVYGRSHEDPQAAWQKSYALMEALPATDPATDPALKRYADQNAPDVSPMVGAVDEMEAIAMQLNQSLGSEQLKFTVEQVEKVLKVTANTDQLLSADTFAKSIRELLMPLNLKGIDVVQVYKRKQRGNSCYKIKDFTITPDQPVRAAGNGMNGAMGTVVKATSSNAQGDRTSRNSSGTSQAQNYPSRKPKRSKATRLLMVGCFIVGGLVFLYLVASKLVRLFTSPFGIVFLLLSVPAMLKFGGRLGNLWSEIIKDD